MAKAAVPAFSVAEQSLAKQVLVVTGASLVIALCARLYVPIPFTPVPLTLGNLAILLAGLMLGSRRGAAAVVVYLTAGAAGLPFFSGGSGVAQLFGVTGGYLLAYPAAAYLTGWLWERSPRTFARAALAAVAGEVVLFAGGIGWLLLVTHSLPQAAAFGLYPFVFAEIAKVTAAAGAAQRWRPLRP